MQSHTSWRPSTGAKANKYALEVKFWLQVYFNGAAAMAGKHPAVVLLIKELVSECKAA